MAVDLRAVVASDLGLVISGDIGANHISDRSGLVMTAGRLVIDGLLAPARGTVVNLLVACPQRNAVTRFPKVLRVIRSNAYPADRRTEVSVGCALTLSKDRRDTENYFAVGTNPINAQDLLTFCLQRIGIVQAPGTRQLSRQYLLPQVDLSRGYVEIIGDLIRSEGCFGRLRPDDKLEILPATMQSTGKGPVLTTADWVTFEPIASGNEPPDRFTVRYKAAERNASSGTGGNTNETVSPLLGYWTSSTTESSPDYVYVRYTNNQGVEKSFSYLNRVRSTSSTEYRMIEYRDKDGKAQRQDVTSYKIDIKEAAAGSVNSSLLSSVQRWDLAVAGLNPGLFSVPVESVNQTWYEYISTTDGPMLVREVTEQRVSELELAASLSIPDYVTLVPSIGGTFVPTLYYMPGLGAEYTSTRTVVEYETVTINVGGGLTRTVTRTKTSRWMSRGLTQEGQQEFQWLIKERKTDAIIPTIVQEYSALKFEGTEVQTSEGKPAIATRPQPQDVAAAGIAQNGTADNTVTGVVLYTAGMPSNNVTTTATYDMPFCPDDVTTAGVAQAAALAFGQSEAALDVGHAYGFNVVTSFDRLPTPELSPVYIRLAGIEVAFLTDSLSYAFDASGMVVSSDLMLLGVTGYYGSTAPASSWIQLSVPTSALRQTGNTAADAVAAKANTIAYPSAFNPRNPAAVFALLGNTGVDTFAAYKADQTVIGPTLVFDVLTAMAGPLVAMVELDYPFDTGTESLSALTGVLIAYDEW